MCYSNFLDKFKFFLYVIVVLYLLNPIALLLITVNLVTVPLLQVQILPIILLLVSYFYYSNYVWIKIRKRFLRFEGMYFGLFIPGKIERRQINIKVKYDNRIHGDTENGKSKN